jgi:hypothetical protein
MRERQGTRRLGLGYHPLRVEYFENGGDAGLILAYSGPGIAKQVVPAAALYRDSTGSLLARAPGQPSALAVRGDSARLELAAACRAADLVRTYGRGPGGTLQAGLTVPVGGAPADVLLAVLTDSDRAAVLTADAGSDTITVAPPAPNGFSESEHYAGPAGTSAVVAARGADGRIRIVALGRTQGQLLSWQTQSAHPACQVVPVRLEGEPVDQGGAWIAPAAILIGNAGGGPLTITAVRSTGPHNLLVQLPHLPPLPATVAPGRALPLDLVMVASDPGERHNSVVIETDDPLYPRVEVPLRLDVSSALAPVQASSPLLELGTLTAGTPVTRQWGLGNVAAATALVRAVRVIGRDAGRFSIQALTLPAALPAQSVLNVKLNVETSTPGTLQAAVVAECEYQGARFAVAAGLHGYVPPPPAPKLTFPAQQTVGFAKVGTSVERYVYGSNDGDADLVVTGGAFTGPGAADYQLLGAWPLTVPPGGNLLAIRVRFTPHADGRSDAALTLASNDPAQPAPAAQLTGEGFTPNFDLQPDHLSLGGYLDLADNPTAEGEAQLSNASPALGTVSVTVSGPFVIVSPTFPLTFNGERSVRVHASKPAATGTYQGYIDFATDDPRHPTLRLGLRANWYHT